MPRRAWSRVVVGAALMAALAAPVSALEREPVRTDVWSLAGSWLGDLWSRAVATISWGIDPDGSAAQGNPTVPGPSGDVSLIIDPNG